VIYLDGHVRRTESGNTKSLHGKRASGLEDRSQHHVENLKVRIRK